MRTEELDDFVHGGDMRPIATGYLNIYVADADWDAHIMAFSQKFASRYGGLNRVKNDEALMWRFKNLIAYTILYPSHYGYGSLNKEHPETLLFTAASHHQYQSTEGTWEQELRQVAERDLVIREFRNQCLTLGWLEPIAHHPYYRQARNWLWQQAEEAGALNDVSKKRFENLVKAYGGAVICNLFSRNRDMLKRVLNWRSGYFFERVIFDTYTLDQVLRVKRAELAKANPSLVRNF